ncbi:MAG TPA: PhoH family protein [Thermodesulfovibrio thiophilus]|uniref:PhoH family protein n=1 Tax=Thermodesulfovibrio thiophilus TaxID=340095 RepID=UPI000427F2C4|nr:PhoH family protein [Thermodesulfovibrio thiophilus]HOA82702.1 PhoH family protein [Thermodesulfovibrio thiophilus]HQA03968.1 PhoH family protein [Thermodesulfovibrio thiophilus]HQD35693.1 PhoH family protein [Thermodesulfovibrio thiophilus]
MIEDTLNVTLTIRGNKLIIHGEDDIDIERTEQIIEEIRAVNREGYIVKPEDIMHSIQGIKEGKPVSVLGLFQGGIPLPSKKRVIIPKTETQKEYMEAMFKYDIVFGIGPAGTGKTYLAMAMAIHFLLTRQVSRIVLVRPAVEAGERLGFLPGAIEEKVSPYLRPLYDALYDMLDFDRASKLIEKGAIEIAPLAFMRGRTLNDAFIILDEAQNTTTEQMKMYLTRLGFGSKTVITGDITQIDLPSQKVSGLVEALKILKDIEGIKTIYFTDRDVVRHRLVQKIIKAYEKHERQSTA